MTSTNPSNIRVTVTFAQSTVFAGEDVVATITFKNITTVALPKRQVTPVERQRRFAPIQGNSGGRGDGAIRNGLRGGIGEGGRGRGRGHRPTLSLSTHTAQGVQTVTNEAAGTSGRVRPRHSRSISIVSLGGEHNKGRGRGVPGHTRSSSVQVGRTSFSTKSTPQPPSLPFPSATDEQSEMPLSVRTPSPNFSTPSVARQEASFREFKFPPQPIIPPSPYDEHPEVTSAVSPRTQPMRALARNQTPRSDEEEASKRAPVNRLLNSAATGGTNTPRPSTEIYSISNHSEETLASEYPAHPPANIGGGLPYRLGHMRQGSRLTVPQEHVKGPEVLMMGYAQISGTFSLDGSLVNTAPFEEVKRKGLISGSGGGGVVGLSSNNRNSGLFGSLGWNSLGSSLNNILGGGELSSIREMRSQSEKKEIPIIATPQSILFVDLRLKPGEERSYAYAFTLPRGLPPSHKGRAMKVSYRLIIGVQRPGNVGNAGVKSVEIPFRVFGGVTVRGEILGHDLMKPYMLLHTPARTAPLTPQSGLNAINGSKTPPSTEDDFQSYIEALLSRPTGTGLLSPTEGPRLFRRQSSLVELDPQTQAEAIDLAILRSNVVSSSSSQSPNKFSIARSGRSVTVIELTRPAYRLGETVTGMLDFEKGEIPVLWVRIWLESAEKVDTSLSMRSEGSVLRATKKTWTGVVENVIWARRVGFDLSIPSSATPEFVTSGVTLEWKLRVEFTTPSLAHLTANKKEVSDSDESSDFEIQEEDEGFPALLEEVSVDDRGKVLAPVERLGIDTFEIGVPIRVYGTPGASAIDGEDEVKEMPI